MLYYFFYVSVLGDSESSLPLTKHSFAAYSEGDFSKWQSVLEHVISESRPSSQWIDSLFSSSARDSMFSGGSGDRLDEREVQFLDVSLKHILGCIIVTMVIYYASTIILPSRATCSSIIDI